jgi:hypothetical protein
VILGVCGLIGSGKDTIADYLVNFHEFKRDSFASSLKDAVAAVFGWDREMLEGRTKQSREWRERVDPWWSKRLDMPNLTPRWILQYWGTDVCRKGFNDAIWIASLENKLQNTTDNVVISDCRFVNEVAAIKNAGGKVVWVKRGPLPMWYETALMANQGAEIQKKQMLELGIHASEWSWIGTDFDAVIDNNQGIEDLYKSIELLINDQEFLEEIEENLVNY